MTSGITAAPCGCRSWFCPGCGPKAGIKLREKLADAVSGWKGMLLLTLTVDPSLFGDPKAAWKYVRDNRCISRLMRELARAGWLESPRYLYVVEWHASGYAHWHVLVEARYIPHATIAAKWGAMRPESAGPVRGDRPAFGFAWISRPRFASNAHGANYVTKYLTKNPEHGYPAWVMGMGAESRVRRYDVSRGFWGTTTARAEPVSTRKRSDSTYAERVEHCGETSNVFARVETTDTRTGEVIETKYKWLGVLAMTRAELLAVRSAEDRKQSRTWWGLGIRDVLAKLAGDGPPPAWKSMGRAA